MEQAPITRTFIATVTNNALEKSKKAETPSVAISLRTSYPIDDLANKYVMNITGHLWLTYKCVERTVKTLQEVFGWKGHNITDFNNPILIGKQCNIVCEEEEFKGKMHWKVKFFNRCPSSLAKLGNDDLQSLVDEVQPMINKFLPNNVTVTQEHPESVAPAKAPSQPIDLRNEAAVPDGPPIDDDLPF